MYATIKDHLFHIDLPDIHHIHNVVDICFFFLKIHDRLHDGQKSGVPMQRQWTQVDFINVEASVETSSNIPR